eukprot:395893_1
MDIEQVVAKYVNGLEEIAKTRNKVLVILDDVDEEYIEEAMEENGISALDYLQDIPYAFISVNANTIWDKLDDACINVVNIRGFTNTASAPAFQFIFNKQSIR